MPLIKTKGMIIVYGPDDRTATKMVATVLNKRTNTILEQKKWFGKNGSDLSDDRVVWAEIDKFLKRYNVTEPYISTTVFGCPHEEGIDYPEGSDCPQCEFWQGKDRWKNLKIQRLQADV